MGRDGQAELDALRESFHGELERKAARIAQLEQLVDETHLRYRSTLSWKRCQTICWPASGALGI